MQYFWSIIVLLAIWYAVMQLLGHGTDEMRYPYSKQRQMTTKEKLAKREQELEDLRNNES